MNKSGVIVLGGHVQGLGITRIYGKQGIPVVVLYATKFNLARHSKYCQQFFHFKENELLDFLLSGHFRAQFQDYSILPTNDKYVEILSTNKKQLSKFYKVGVEDWSVTEICYNKRLAYDAAMDVDLPIAQTQMPSKFEDIIFEEIEYPCIIKPAVMHGFYAHFKTKVFFCNSKEELVSSYKKAIEFIPENEIIIQQIIEGASDHLYSACILMNKGELINYFVGRRARQHPPDFGNATTFAQIVDNDLLIEESLKLLKHIEYNGICEVEYKYDPSVDKYYFLEVNPRTWKWHSIAERANVNILENYYNLLNNMPIKPQKKIEKATSRHLITDIPMWFKYKIKGIYKKHPSYPVKYAVWETGDLKPAFFELIYLPFLIWKR
jgi:predicted ATP-grasp superfamily ATP-dependent carboligase